LNDGSSDRPDDVGAGSERGAEAGASLTVGRRVGSLVGGATPPVRDFTAGCRP
jgi:hypothetical protein